MQTDRDALLAGILADPDADLPRLVFADWLEETGHPANCARAEYIRLAIERVVRHRSGSPRHNLMKRFDARLWVLEEMFDDGLASFANAVPIWFKCDRTRGFISRLDAHAECVGPELQELLRRHPIVQFSVWNTPTGSDRLTELHLPISLRRFSFMQFQNGGPDLIDILRVAHTPRLRNITVESCGLTDAHIVRLVQTLRLNPSLRGVESLILGNNPLTDHAAHTLAAADWPPTLRSLNVDGTRITNAGRDVLFRRFGFEELRPRLALS